jgi:hypothetical protein
LIYQSKLRFSIFKLLFLFIVTFFLISFNPILLWFLFSFLFSFYFVVILIYLLLFLAFRFYFCPISLFLLVFLVLSFLFFLLFYSFSFTIYVLIVLFLFTIKLLSLFFPSVLNWIYEWEKKNNSKSNFEELNFIISEICTCALLHTYIKCSCWDFNKFLKFSNSITRLR